MVAPIGPSPLQRGRDSPLQAGRERGRQSVQDARQHSLFIVEDVVVPEAQDTKAVPHQIAITLLVIRAFRMLAAVSLDPYAAQETILHVPLDRLGIPEDETYQVHDLLSGERALWQGSTATVRLTPEKPAALWSVLRFRRSEQGFDYYF